MSTRVLIVDDSRLMREMLADIVAATPGLEVAGTAADGHSAVEMAARLRPDVVTLDVEMPGMNGLATLDALLAAQPLPVIMVSSQTRPGATTTLDALDRGALDYVAKPEGAAQLQGAFRDELLRKINSLAGADVARVLRIRRQRKDRPAAAPPTGQPITKTPASEQVTRELGNFCIALGISTGGPPALSVLFESLEPPLPPLVIVQHMPPQFTGPLAWRLNSIAKLSVKEAASGDVLVPNSAYIAPGGKHLGLRRRGSQVVVEIRDGDVVSGHRPSVDVMMTDVAQIFGPRTLGVVMTGMGRDGADGCKCIRQAGGYVLGQDQATSDVYGMNKVAFNEGGVDRQFGLPEGAALISEQARRLARRPAAKPAPAVAPRTALFRDR